MFWFIYSRSHFICEGTGNVAWRKLGCNVLLMIKVARWTLAMQPLITHQPAPIVVAVNKNLRTSNSEKRFIQVLEHQGRGKFASYVEHSQHILTRHFTYVRPSSEIKIFRLINTFFCALQLNHGSYFGFRYVLSAPQRHINVFNAF